MSIHDGQIKGFDDFDPANTVKVDKTVEEVSPAFNAKTIEEFQEGRHEPRQVSQMQTVT